METMIQIARGKKVTVMSGITVSTTSANQDSRGHNAILLYFNMTAGTGTFTVKIQGKVPDTVDTYVDVYDNNDNLLAMSSVTASQGKFLVGLPYDFKIVATEDVDGATVTVAYELLSV